MEILNFRKMSQYLPLLIIISIISPASIAKNIDLSTIPARENVQLTIYNAVDLTLVRETRQVSIKKGLNRLQFSWVNTQIDPTSVQLLFVSHEQNLNLVNTTFPHGKPQMLYWNIKSDVEVLSTVEISYFTSGISWQADYSGIMDGDGKSMLLDSFVTITNNSGEDYQNAKVRLVIGEINLVESIEELVRQANQKKDQLGYLKQVKRDHAKKLMSKAPGRYELRARELPMAAMNEAMVDVKTVEKDSISEYTIFSIEGMETIPNKWSKRLRSNDTNTIKVKTEYRYRPREYGEQLVAILIFGNDQEANLGESPLPSGTIQLYQGNEYGGLSYIAVLPLKYTSIGDKVELNMGQNPDIYFDLVNLKNWRDNIWMHYKKGNLYRRVDDGNMIIEHNSQVAGWDEHYIYLQHIRNHTNHPIEVEIRRLIDGDAKFSSMLKVKQHDFQHVNIYARLESGESQQMLYQTSIAKGRNSKQNQLVLKQKNISYPEF